MSKPLIAMAGAFLLAGGVFAPGWAASPVSASLDTDNDGTVSLYEAKAAAVMKFDKLDTDHDGKLDPGELTGIVDARRVARVDRDRDGTLDRAEWMKLVQAQFKQVDTDRDGKLDAAELSTPAGQALERMLQP